MLSGVKLDSALIPTYLPTMPVNPGLTSTSTTGYYFMKNAAGRTIIGSCYESEYATASIKVQR
jgi:hypothetical protein